MLLRGPGGGGAVGEGIRPAAAALGIPDGAAGAERSAAIGGGIAAEAEDQLRGGIEGPVLQSGDAGREPDPLQVFHGAAGDGGGRAAVAGEGGVAHGGGAGKDLIDFTGPGPGVSHQGPAVVGIEDAVHALVDPAGGADIDAGQIRAVVEHGAVGKGRLGGQGDGGQLRVGEGVLTDGGDAGADGDGAQAGAAEGELTDRSDRIGDRDGGQAVTAAEHILADLGDGAQAHAGQGIAVVEDADIHGGSALDDDGLQLIRVAEAAVAQLADAGRDGDLLYIGAREAVGADVAHRVAVHGGGHGDSGGGTDVFGEADLVGAHIDRAFPAAGGEFVLGILSGAAQDHPDGQGRGPFPKDIALRQHGREGIFSAGGGFREAGAGEEDRQVAVFRGDGGRQELQDRSQVHRLLLAHTGQGQLTFFQVPLRVHPGPAVDGLHAAFFAAVGTGSALLGGDVGTAAVADMGADGAVLAADMGTGSEAAFVAAVDAAPGAAFIAHMGAGGGAALVAAVGADRAAAVADMVAGHAGGRLPPAAGFVMALMAADRQGRPGQQPQDQHRCQQQAQKPSPSVHKFPP